MVVSVQTGLCIEFENKRVSDLDNNGQSGIFANGFIKAAA